MVDVDGHNQVAHLVMKTREFVFRKQLAAAVTITVEAELIYHDPDGKCGREVGVRKGGVAVV